ncbi:uncharacterized protein LOC142550075 [Primulina tabacum]|uniref:uncharacterized protein LOC142550075 n=1 Tax=Primulina tabacum TaxID=48773 RepID=UPI003F595663
MGEPRPSAANLRGDVLLKEGWTADMNRVRKYTDSLMDPLATNTAFRPPILDGSNYALWRVKMRIYIKSIEERAWQRVLDGWSPPRIVDDDGDSRSKLESSCLINNCISAKEAWDILQKHCEGSESVRRTKIRMLTSKFESLRMEENETIVEYDRRLREIANEAFSLGDPLSNERLVSKVLRSLPERFNIKIGAIDESKDTSTLNMEDLISSLRTFEMNLDLQKRYTGKAVALQTTDDSMNSLIQEAKDSDLGEESISLITKKFGDYLKRMRDKKKIVSTSRPQFVPFERNKITASIQGNFRSRNDSSARTETKKLDLVQCRECSGFGHYANECANRLRKNKNMAAPLSDEDPDDDFETKEGDDCTSLYAIQEQTYKSITLVLPLVLQHQGATLSDKIHESDQEELTMEIVQRIYEELYDDWLKRNKANSLLSKENTELKSNLSRLEVLLSRKDLELCKVKDDLEKASKTLAKFNSSSSKLDIVLTMGKDSRSGHGYVASMYEHGESSNSNSRTTIFVKGVGDDAVTKIENPHMKTVQSSKLVSEQTLKTSCSTSSPSKSHSSAKMAQDKKHVSISNPKQRKHHFICHYCRKSGHIKPFCYKLRNDYLRWHSNQVLHKVLSNTMVKSSSTKKIWVPKTVIQCNVIYTSLKTNIAGAWYFDSGCSRHMKGSKEHLIDYSELKSGRVTYGGGAKGRIVGNGTLNVDGLPILHNVLHVEGLNSNLISISQLCDDDLHVRFNKNNCEVFNDANVCVMSGTRSADNCYLVGDSNNCRSDKVSNLVLWHQKLGHVSFKTLKNICKYEAVRGQTGKSKVDDTEGLLDSNESSTSIGVETGVETSETTPCSTLPLTRTEAMENENVDDDDVVINYEKEILRKIQKNHPSSQIIGEIHEDV